MKPSKSVSSHDALSDEAPRDTVFTVGIDPTFPPFADEADNGDYVGFDMDIVDEIARRNGWIIVKKPIIWEDRDKELEANLVDCVCSGFTCTGREDLYEWTRPYINNSIVIVTMPDSGIKSAEDLEGKSVCVQNATSAEDILIEMRIPPDKIRRVKDYTKSINMVMEGDVDCAAMDRFIAAAIINDLPENSEKPVIVEKPINNEQYAIGLLKGNTALRDIVDRTLGQMIADGTVRNISKKYSQYSLEDVLCEE